MRILRLLLILVAVITAFAGLAVLIALSPTTQTWYVNRLLSRRWAGHASVETATIGLSAITLGELRIEQDGAVFTARQIDAALPVKAALWDHRVAITKLVAQDCWFEIGPGSANATEPAARATPKPDQTGRSAPPPALVSPTVTAKALRAWLAALRLPPGWSIGAIDLDGEVHAPVLPHREPVAAHLEITGSDIAAGKTATLRIRTATTVGTGKMDAVRVVTEGQGEVRLGTTGAIESLSYRAKIASDAKALPSGLQVTGGIEVPRGTEATPLTIEISRGERHLVTLHASASPATRLLTGTWAFDLNESESAALIASSSPLPFVMTGHGTFATDLKLDAVQATGVARAKIPAPGPFDGATLTATFDAVHRDGAVRLDQLEVTCENDAPVATLRSLQPFRWRRDGTIELVDGSAEWLQLTITRLPLRWLPPLPTGAAFTGGTAQGEFAVKRANGGLVVEPKAPLVATGLALRTATAALLSGIDAKLLPRGRYAAGKGWEFETGDTTITCGAETLVTLKATVTPLHEPYRDVTIVGTAKASPDAWARQPWFAAHPWLKGQSLTADFTANLGSAGDVVAKLTFTGHASDHSLTANLATSIDNYREFNFRMPFTVTVGKSTAELAANGTWAIKPNANQVDFEISSNHVDLDHVRFLGAFAGNGVATALASLLDGSTVPPLAPAGPRDTRPFWGNLLGRLRLDFREVVSGKRALENVAGTLGFEPGVLRLNGGRGVFNPWNGAKLQRGEPVEMPTEPRTLFGAQGEVRFAPERDRPYTLEFAGSVDELDVTRLLGATNIAGTPLIEGHVALAIKATGEGPNLAHLLSGRHDEFKLTSKSGVLRLLKTDVASAIPDAPTPVSDTLGTVGSAFGKIFGRKGNTVMTDVHLGKATEAILNATYEMKEFAFTDLAVTATRTPGSNIALSDITIVGRNERVAGTGTLLRAAGQPLHGWPVELQLQLGFKGTLAERLTTAGVLGARKDSEGYAQLPNPLPFGGTLSRFDNTAWHTLLVEAATATVAKPAAR